MHPLENYLSELREIRSTGGAVAETSYYGPLERLLNEIGRQLKPRVRCVSQLANIGAGNPDFGLYTADQFQRDGDEPLPGALPERGVVEVKPWTDDSFLTARGDQVSRYWQRYKLVMVTNYRDFVVVVRDESGRPQRGESIRLAEDAVSFREMLAHPHRAAQTHGERLEEFLKRALLTAAPLTDSEDLAWFLASHAKEARARVEAAAGLEALGALKQGLEEALGMKFEGEKGEHFFQATFVQTLFYGVFSSWVLWAREKPRPQERFDWHAAGWTLHVPMIASLFSQIATRERLKPLQVDEVLDWSADALNRVDRAAFFAKFEEEHAVQYFYEPFLKAYDPELRKEYGVWYTPPEIVRYQVERVDRVLREELELSDGLADERVIILDPCCGTGAYLVEVLRRIHTTLQEKSADALVAQRLKKAAIQRVFGFEIMPAPFVVAHLQLGLILRRLGAPLDEAGNERAGVYLTNALTGWEPVEKPKDLLPFPEFQAELDAANRVKQAEPILVILGNPPYNAFAGTSPKEEGGLVEAYKEGLTKPVKDGGWGIKKFNLDDLYVRFFRIAERRIVKTGKGVVTYISSFSYLDDPSFVVMRRRFLEEFDKIWIDCMNGDSRETGKQTPDGKPDPSVFSTEDRPVGIRLGTAVCIMVRRHTREKKPVVRFRHYWGVTKRKDILLSLNVKGFDRKYPKANPTKTNRFSFKPTDVDGDYARWPKVTALCAQPPSNGLMEKRGGALIDIDRELLAKRMKAYFNKNLDWETAHRLIGSLGKNMARYNAKKAREKILELEKFQGDHLRSYAVRPFDVRWCYFSPNRPLWNEPRPSYEQQCWEGNSFFMTRFHSSATPEGSPCAYVTGLSDDHYLMPDNACFPIRLRDGHQYHNPDDLQGDLLVRERFEPDATANLSKAARAYLKSIGIRDPDRDADTAGLVWMHALAIGHSPAYLAENTDGIRQDWPRIPLPATKQALLNSAVVGRRVAALLDIEKPVSGVSPGRIPPLLRAIGAIRKAGGGELDPARGDLDLTAGWGHAGKGGVVMPGRGRIESETIEYQAGAEKGLASALGHQPTLEQVKAALGERSHRIYLSDAAYWDGIPEKVWELYIGGYQVMKKWLSYREKSILGRGLKLEEAEYVTEMARRLAALCLLQPALDENYRAVKSNSWPWPRDE
jgi:hypothetical protein